MKSPIKIASRSSPLALAQVDEIIRELKAQGQNLNFKTLKIDTAGDKDKTTPLTMSRDDFFTDAIDQALLQGKADIAVHSAKDLPQQLPKGIKIFALTKGLEDKDAWVSPFHWKDLPPKSKVGTSSFLRQKQILAMRPDVTIVNIRGTINERLQLVKEGTIDGVVVASCALKRLKLDKEIKDVFPWEGLALQGQLAVVGRQDDPELEKLFNVLDARRNYGKVSLVGAGPGDPELITLKGVKALEGADYIFYDYLVDDSLLKHASQAEHFYAGKRKGEHSLSQEDLSRMLKEKAFAGKNVVRLKGGDPLIFGRGADEIQYLRSYHINVEIIPGISSATGIPSSLGIPLTARGISSSVAFLSAHEEDEHKDHPKPVQIPKADTIVFLMGLTKLAIIVKSLQKAGWPKDTPMMIVSNGTKLQEQIVEGTLASIVDLAQKQDLNPPALIIVGKTIGFYKPHPQKIFLHCGTHPDLYKDLGKILSWPMIDIQPVIMNEAQQKNLLKAFGSADLIICTSSYAVESFFHVITRFSPGVIASFSPSVIASFSPGVIASFSPGVIASFSPGVIASEAKQSLKEQLKNKQFAVIGRRTEKALQVHHIQAAIVSEVETAQGLLETITRQMKIKGKRILFPRSNLPNPFLKDALIKQGALVTEVTIYENTKPPTRDLPSGKIDGIIFTSPSTVRNFLMDYGTIPSFWSIKAKGPVTLKTLQDEGYTHATSLS